MLQVSKQFPFQAYAELGFATVIVPVNVEASSFVVAYVILNSLDGFDEVGVGVYVGPAVGVGVGVYVGPAVGVGVGVFVGANVGVGVVVGPVVGVGVGDDEGVGVAVGPLVGVGVGVEVGAGVPACNCQREGTFGGSQPTCEVCACIHL